MNLPTLFEERMKKLLGQEYTTFINSYDKPLRRGLRVNTAKISVEKFRRLFPLPLSPSPFADNAFYVDTDFKAGSDPLHHCGAYYMQEPSAASAVTILNPQPNEWVLDLCAAPGGKSTQIATELQGKGLLWSNEYVASRAKILQQNLERCGVRNAVVSNRDTAVLCEGLSGLFDAVLVDAPCSGEGMFRKEPQALSEWSMDNILLCARRQKDILDNASKAVKPGGRLVYSTCTFAPEENEGVVAHFLSTHSDFTLLPISVPWGSNGFSASDVQAFCPDINLEFDLTGCRRILPHHGGEGHFIALFQKSGDSGETCSTTNSNRMAERGTPDAALLYSECFNDEPNGDFITNNEIVRLVPRNLPDCRSLGVLSAGIAVASVCKNRLEPHHNAFIAARKENCKQSVDLPLNDPLLRAFLHGEEIPCPECKGWTAVCVDGIPVGFGKASGGRLKNRYPKGLRLI